MAVHEHGHARIDYDVAGEGAPVLLLHGFPQTRAMWSEVVPVLAQRRTVVTADLRGYGASVRPEGGSETMTFRAMADDMRSLMASLGYERFDLVGHDRGARVAYRLALDTPEAMRSLTLMDILPTDWLLDHWEIEVARAYFHWTYLAQPVPLPERMIGADPDLFFESCLLGWGGARIEDFPEAEAYRSAWRRPDVIAAMVDDYRAAVDEDQVHDRADKGRVLEIPALVMWGEDGVMGRGYDVAAIWAKRLSRMTGQAMPGGHFFVDLHGEETARALDGFLR